MANWTDAQRQAIQADSGEILVSASAGSGKTSVMIERLVRLIVNGVDVDNVLCLTFTKAASNEMKERLRATLLKTLKGEKDEKTKARLLTQLDRLSFATITTIDSFCNKLVQKYFEKTDLPANFTLATPEDANALKYASATAVLERFGEEDDQEYYNLIGFLGKKRQTDSVLKILTSIYDFLFTLPSANEYLDEIVENYEKDVRENPVVLYVFDKFKHDLKELETCVLSAYGAKTTYTDEMLTHFNYLRNAYYGGLEKFSEAIKKPFPEKPNFQRKEYKNLDEENKKKVDELRTKAQKIQEKYAEFDLLQIENDKKALFPYVKKLVEIIRAFCAEYTARKREENLTDFAEIEQNAYKLLCDSDINAQVRAKYTHVLVDEYQDTNRLQENILRLAGGMSSRFMVGDAKQSIYSFRHTEPEIFIEKRGKEGIETILLKENFRQSKEILNAVNEIFISIMQKDWAGIDYKSEEMIAGLLSPAVDSPFELCFIDDGEKADDEKEISLYSVMENAKENDTVKCAEGEYVYKKIVELVGREKIYDAKQDGEDKNRYIRFGDIVVLYRKNSEHIKDIIKYLKGKGVPVGEKGEEYLPVSAEILIHFLRVLANPQNDESLAIVMLSGFFGFLEDELLEYRRVSGDNKKSLFRAFYSVREKYPKLKAFFEKFLEYITRSEYTDVYNLLNYVVIDTGFDKAVANREGGEREYKLLSAYLNALKQSTVSESVATYLAKFDKYPEFKTKQESGGHDSVRFMTMHGSKGLEFPVVFLVDLDKPFIKNDVKKSVIFHKKLGVTMPSFDVLKRESRENFLGSATKSKILDENAVQELRLLYVALTRGRNKIFVSGKNVASAEKKDGAESASSLMDFIRIALNNNPALNSLIKVENYSLGEVDASSVQEEFDISADVIEKAKKNLDFVYPYELSTKTPTKYTVTALTQDEYAGEDGVAIPLSFPESADVGTLYHTVMQKIDLSATSREQIEKELDKMVLDEAITTPDKEKIDISVLEKVLNTPIMQIARENPIKREQSFLLRTKCSDIKDTECDDEVLLQGAIDLLILTKNGAIVVDYKYSGASEEALIARYKKQLELYKKATQEILGEKEVRACLLSLKTAKSVEI